MTGQGFVIFVALVWLAAMLKLLPRAWRLDHVCPGGAHRRKPRTIPSLKVHPTVLQPLLSLCL
jgi:hypothetical protein